MDKISLTPNQAKALEARDKIAAYRSRTNAEILETLKGAYINAEEQAGMAGVATLDQHVGTYIDLNIAADIFGGSFVDMENLAFGQVPYYKTRELSPVRVTVGNLAGTPPMVYYATKQTPTQVTPFQYFSDEFRVPNLVNANFALEAFQERESAIERVMHDMDVTLMIYRLNFMLGQSLLNPLAASFATYFGSTPFSGKKPFVLDPYVAAGSVPNTNIIDTNTEGGLTKTFFLKQRTFATQMGRKVTAVFCPVTGSPWEATWTQASVIAYTGGQGNQNVSKAISPDKWEEVISSSFSRDGAFMNWFGEAIFVKPINVLPTGYTIASTDMPAMLQWNQLDQSVSQEEAIAGDRADNMRYEKRSIAFAQPDPLLRNFIVQKMQ